MSLGWRAVACIACGVAPALADTNANVMVWYRSADGCPDPAAFIERVRERIPHARLASVGDRIDFVVTLGTNGDDGAGAGRLERQSKAGTVAIRELDGESCDRVAEGLILSLALAAQPGSEGGSEASDTNAKSSPEQSAVSAGTTESRRAAESAQVDRTTDPVADAVTRPGADRADRGRPGAWLLGLDVTVTTGVAPDPMPGAGVFAQYESRTVLRGSSLRLSALGATTATSSEDLRLWVGSGRLEGCSLKLGSDELNVRTCLAFDLGAIGAEGLGADGVQETALWSSVGAHGRLEWLVSDPWTLEAELGGAAPLIRYELISSSNGTLHRVAPVGLTGAIGAAMRLP